MVNKKYNKLVRDNIPQVIEKEGKECTFHYINKEDYVLALHKKLDEEVEEFHQDPNEEELADILEVMNQLIKVYGYDWEQIKVVQNKKRIEKGGFEKGIILEGVIE